MPPSQALLQRKAMLARLQRALAERQKMLASQSREFSDKMLARQPLSGGRPTKEALKTRNALLQGVEKFGGKLKGDKAFGLFVGNAAREVSRHYSPRQLSPGQPLLRTAIENLSAEYALMKEIKVPQSIIKQSGHKHPVFWFDGIYSQAQRVFGAGKESEPLVRTAAFQIFARRYGSVDDAKRAYDGYLADARKVFGAGKESEPLVRTAAIELFERRYKSVDDAKRAYDGYLADARKVFGAGKESEPLVRTAAVQLFTKKYGSVDDAKRAYDKILAKKKKAVRDIVLQKLEKPDLRGCGFDEAFHRLTPVLNSVADRFSSSHLGREDAFQEAALAAIEKIRAGERDADKIIDAVMQRVTKLAARYSFKALPLPLKPER